MARKGKTENELSRCRAAGVATLLMMLPLAGCSRAPVFNVLGSFFPAWIVCGAIGLLLTGLVRLLFVRIGLEQYLLPLIFVYPCLAGFFTFALWLLFYS